MLLLKRLVSVASPFLEQAPNIKGLNNCLLLRLCVLLRRRLHTLFLCLASELATPVGTMKLQAMRLQRSQGLQARPRRSAVVSVRAIAEQVEVPSALKSGGSSWKPTSWREKPALQQPDYLDKAEVAKACEVGHRTLRRVTKCPARIPSDILDQS